MAVINDWNPTTSQTYLTSGEDRQYQTGISPSKVDNVEFRFLYDDGTLMEFVGQEFSLTLTLWVVKGLGTLEDLPAYLQDRKRNIGDAIPNAYAQDRKRIRMFVDNSV